MERLEDALMLLDQGDVPGAAELLAQLAARTPAHATVHVLLAQAYERQHRWNEALAAWQTAHLFLPDVPLVLQGSLRAARVLAALRTMTGPAVLVPPPLTPDAPPEPPPAESLQADTPPDDIFDAPVWDPAPAFAPETPTPDWNETPSETEQEDTSAPFAPTESDDAPSDEASAVFPEEAPADVHDTPAFETGVLDDVDAPGGHAWADDVPEGEAFEETEDLADAEFLDFGAPEEDAGTGAPDDNTALPDVSLPWQGTPDAPEHADPTPDAASFEEQDVFFDFPPNDSEEHPPEAAPTDDNPNPEPENAAQPTTLSGVDLAQLGTAPPASPIEPPRPVDESVKGPYEPFDLDDLIASLSGAGRIVPNPDPAPPPTFDEDAELDDMVSPTLARIHAAQGQYESAARIYDRLAEQEPLRAAEYRAEAEAMREKEKQK